MSYLRYDVFDSSPLGAHTKVINLVPKNSKVLEVGCATGWIGRELKKKNCEIVGIEMDKASGDIAKKIYNNVIIGDIEKLSSVSYPEKFFDRIIFADVLEHLRDPVETLVKLRKYIAEDGEIIVSLPNIAHVSVRINLLKGNFNYTETGILDRTHLRFFTFRSACQLLLESGYKIKNIDYSYYGLPAKTALLRKMPKLFAVQFIFTAISKARNLT